MLGGLDGGLGASNKAQGPHQALGALGKDAVGDPQCPITENLKSSP